MAASRYWELDLPVTDDIAEGLTNFLWELGALGVVEEGVAGSVPRLRAFFPGQVDARAVETRIGSYLAGLRALGFPTPAPGRLTPLLDTGWAEAWREHFRPRPIGRRLLVAPPWDTPPSERLTIVIEPGRAFGTGHHGSTAGCLEHLETIVERERPATAIDVGTGSGILAIAAARLGVGRVLAIDDDPDAVACATANAALNGVADRVLCQQAPAAALSAAPAPLVMANLLSIAHLRLASVYRRCVAPGGALVLGGILDAESETVTAALAGHGFERRASRSVEDWTTLELHAPVHHRP